eukprot:TCONS_00055566-protein
MKVFLIMVFSCYLVLQTKGLPKQKTGSAKLYSNTMQPCKATLLQSHKPCFPMNLHEIVLKYRSSDRKSSSSSRGGMRRARRKNKKQKHHNHVKRRKTTKVQ